MPGVPGIENIAMILYNITTQVTWAIHDRWKEWLLNEYLPEILSTGLFERYQVVRLLEVAEDDGPTYAVQLYARNSKDFHSYRNIHLESFEKKEQDVWGNNIVSFQSLMEVIN